MRPSSFFVVLGIAASTLTCSNDGCGGSTCPFEPPSHHAVVRGTVLDLNAQPLAGIHTQVRFEHQMYSGVGLQTNSLGRFEVTARADVATGTVIDAWLHVAQANLPPAEVITDSVPVQLRFKPRSEPPEIVEVVIQLPVRPTCTAVAVPGIRVVITDSVSGEPRAMEAVAVAREGAFVDTLDPAVSQGNVLISRQGAYERPGTYEVVVRAPGYLDWARTNVIVTSNECHVNPVQLEARLQVTP
jgi:hypothetical protein